VSSITIFSKNNGIFDRNKAELQNNIWRQTTLNLLKVPVCTRGNLIHCGINIIIDLLLRVIVSCVETDTLMNSQLPTQGGAPQNTLHLEEQYSCNGYIHMKSKMVDAFSQTLKSWSSSPYLYRNENATALFLGILNWGGKLEGNV